MDLQAWGDFLCGSRGSWMLTEAEMKNIHLITYEEDNYMSPPIIYLFFPVIKLLSLSLNYTFFPGLDI